jgi:hypothetical protein
MCLCYSFKPLVFNFLSKREYEMADIKHVIEPERFGLWIAATFVIALLALVVALISLTRVSDLMYITQAETILLNKKIENANTSADMPAPPVQEEQQ